MFDIFSGKKYKKQYEDLEERFYKKCKSVLTLEKAAFDLRIENDELKAHLQAMATLCAALSDLLTEEQKKVVSKKIKVKTSKKGKKDGKTSQMWGRATVACRFHKPKVEGSTPSPATIGE